MTKPCDQLEPYLDGELSGAEAQAFHAHLATCPDCPARLDSAMQLAALAAEASNAGKAPPPFPEAVVGRPEQRRAFMPRWARRIATLATITVAGLALFFVPLPESVWFPGGSSRQIDPWLTHTSGHRPYRVSLGPEDERPLGLVPLAVLTIRRDQLGIAEAQLARGQFDLAGKYLKDAAPSDDVDVARALVAWKSSEQDPAAKKDRSAKAEVALKLLDGVLARDPRHPQARWAKALVLEDLGLKLAAAEEFLQVAALSVPGWSDEARDRARLLQQQARDSDQGAKGWMEALHRSRKVIAGEISPPFEDEVLRHPGTWRTVFYDAVRAAGSAEAVLALVPAAAALDRLAAPDTEGGREYLTEYVQWAAKRDFGPRAPLAERYRRLYSGHLKGAEVRALVRDAEAAGESDIVFGVLHRGNLIGEERARIRELLGPDPDPWLRWTVIEEIGRADVAAGRYLDARRDLVAATGTCRGAAFAFRCAWLNLALVDLYTRLHQLDEATASARDGLAFARAGHEWGLQYRFLQHLGQISRLRRELSVMHGYLTEALLHAAGDDREMCAIRSDVRELLASAALLRMAPDDAARELAADAGCSEPSLFRSSLLVSLARQRKNATDLPKVRAELEKVRDQPANAGERLLATRLIAEVERLEGNPQASQHLEDVIREADRLPDDPNARKARAYAFISLVREAGKLGAFDEVLERTAAEVGIPEPRRCALAVEANDEILVLAGRDQDGRTFGHYRDDNRERFEYRKSFQGVVPEELVTRLRPCDRVDVIARPPAIGRKETLPPEMAWSYRLQAPVPAQGGVPHRLVVTGVRAPEELHLPRLNDWTAPQGPEAGTTVLRGEEARPSAVLAAMPGATEIAINTHALPSRELDTSYLVLSPEISGDRFELFDKDIRKLQLTRRPIVFLGACNAAETGPYPHEPTSLPAAFITAGARAVLAPARTVPDVDMGAFFDEAAKRIRAGGDPAKVARDLRTEWSSKPDSAWARDVLVFE